MPSPILLPQDKAIAYINDGEVPPTGTPELWKMRAALKKEIQANGGKVIHLLGPRDVRYLRSDIDKLIQSKAA